MLRDILAAVAGVAVAFVTVMLVQMLGHRVYPPPAGLNFEDTQAMTAYIAALPLGAFLFVLLSYIAAAFVGTRVACLAGRAKPAMFALAVGILMLVATITNLIMIPHPAWFSVSAIAGIVAAAWLAARMAGSMRPAREAPK